MLHKRLFIALLSLTLITACEQKQADNTQNTNEQTQTTSADTEHHEHDEHDEHHDHDHEHDGHDHHDHEHPEGDAYSCDNGKTAHIVVHNHEGEIEAHAVIDDIEYDLPQDASNKNLYSSPEGLNNQGMNMTLTNNQAVFSSLDGKTVHMTCQKAG